jgi:hypothetical protein
VLTCNCIPREMICRVALIPGPTVNSILLVSIPFFFAPSSRPGLPFPSGCSPVAPVACCHAYDMLTLPDTKLFVYLEDRMSSSTQRLLTYSYLLPDPAAGCAVHRRVHTLPFGFGDSDRGPGRANRLLSHRLYGAEGLSFILCCLFSCFNSSLFTLRRAPSAAPALNWRRVLAPSPTTLCSILVCLRC